MVNKYCEKGLEVEEYFKDHCNIFTTSCVHVNEKFKIYVWELHF